jgi:hypothetical protein
MAAYSKISGSPHADVVKISGVDAPVLGELSGTDTPANNLEALEAKVGGLSVRKPSFRRVATRYLKI